MASRIGRALQLGAGFTLYGVPWFVARSYKLSRLALRWSLTAVRLGWKDGLHEPA